MKTWQDYKKTYRTEADLFDFARLGDFRGLANALSNGSELDLNALNHRGHSPLMLAVYNGERDFCEALLKCGADVNSKDFVGNTVLMASAFKGNLEILKLLLQYGAAETLQNESNMNARDWAAMFGRTQIVQYLDATYPQSSSPSKIRSMVRFVRLFFIMLQGMVLKR